MTTMEWIKKPTITRDYAFDRVTVSGRPNGGDGISRPLFSIVGKVYSEYPSGPGLFGLSELAGEIVGPGFYGLESCRSLGWQGGAA